MLNEDLEQRELFNKFYEITDQAIDKAVSFQDIDGLSVSQNELIRDCIKRTLITAKKDNNCNEVAVVLGENLDLGTEFGTAHGVDINSNPFIRDIIRLNEFSVVFHNHPSTQSFSVTDLRYFLENSSIKVFGVVSNLGNVEILYRRYTINSKMCVKTERRLNKFFNTQIKSVDIHTVTTKELYKIGLRILSEFKSVGYYIHLK